jgi:hypothetical protein
MKRHAHEDSAHEPAASPKRPLGPRPFSAPRAHRAAWLLLVTAALWWAGSRVAFECVEAWWFEEAGRAAQVDYSGVHASITRLQRNLGLAGALVVAGLMCGHGLLAIARVRVSPASIGSLVPPSFEKQSEGGGDESRRGEALAFDVRWIPLEDKLQLDRFRPWGFAAAVGFASWLGSAWAARAWALWLGWRHAQPWGQRDPHLGLDVSFYVWTLPALDMAWRFVFAASWLALGLSIGIYVYEEMIRLSPRKFEIEPSALRHLGAQAALLACWKALGGMLYAPQMLLRDRTQLANGQAQASLSDWAGPHALDWSWRVPLATAAALGTLACAAACWRACRRNRQKAALGWALAAPLGSFVLVQCLPLAREALTSPEQRRAADAPFFALHRQWTLASYGLVSLNRAPGPDRALGSGSPAPQVLARAPEETRVGRALESLPRWTPSALQQRAQKWARARGQEAAPGGWSLLPPDGFAAANQSDSRLGLAWIAALQPRTAPAPTWEQRHIDAPLSREAVAVPSYEADPQPQLVPLRGPLLVSVAPTLSTTLPLTPDAPSAQPRALGQSPAPASFFNAPARRAGATAPAGTGAGFLVLPPASPRSQSQDGVAGVTLDAPWKRWAAAWRFGSLSLALSGRVQEGSRLVWRTDASERVRALAPFLSWPDAPQFTVDTRGQATWLLQGYTLSDSFPLAQASDEGWNWARASVVASVEASSGDVRLYAREPSDPFLALLERAFPGLLQPIETMPPHLRGALLFPARLLAAQASVASRYASPQPSLSAWSPQFAEAASPFLPPFAARDSSGALWSGVFLLTPRDPQSRTEAPDVDIQGVLFSSYDALCGATRQSLLFWPRAVPASQLGARGAARTPPSAFWSARPVGFDPSPSLSSWWALRRGLSPQHSSGQAPMEVLALLKSSGRVISASSIPELLSAIRATPPSERTVSPSSGVSTARAAAKSTAAVALAKARQLWAQMQSARAKGDWARYEQLSRRLGLMLDPPKTKN